jgi:hypothetical protein
VVNEEPERSWGDHQYRGIRVVDRMIPDEIRV